VLADTEFGTIEFLKAVRKRHWRAVVGMRSNRQMENGKTLRQLYRTGKRGQQVRLVGITSDHLLILAQTCLVLTNFVVSANSTPPIVKYDTKKPYLTGHQ